MKAKRTKKSAAPAGSRKVRLQHRAPEAQRVCVAGTFNNWQPDAVALQRLALQRQADGVWTIELELAPGMYKYRFIVDGVWCDDPQAALTLPNPFGGCNAVLLVSATD
jgi:1,4-alpha-glucan branching enzyme